jgi:hypothetical protein
MGRFKVGLGNCSRLFSSADDRSVGEKSLTRRNTLTDLPQQLSDADFHFVPWRLYPHCS